MTAQITLSFMRIRYYFGSYRKIMVYSQDMLLIYGECRRNSPAARDFYAERYPLRTHPGRHYFLKVEREFRRERVTHENQLPIINENTEINVLVLVEINPSASIREIASELDLGRESVRKILKNHKFKSYKYQLHQALYENDFMRRIEYCRWLIDNEIRSPNFHHKILFSDESRYTNNGMFNRNNLRYWARENSRLCGK